METSGKLKSWHTCIIRLVLIKALHGCALGFRSWLPSPVSLWIPGQLNEDKLQDKTYHTRNCTSQQVTDYCQVRLRVNIPEHHILELRTLTWKATHKECIATSCRTAASAKISCQISSSWAASSGLWIKRSNTSTQVKFGRKSPVRHISKMRGGETSMIYGSNVLKWSSKMKLNPAFTLSSFHIFPHN